MPVKSIKEMTARERRAHSLSARMFNSILVSCIILGIVLLVIGLGLYGLVLSEQYLSSAFDLSASTAESLIHGTNAIDFSERVMERYSGLSEEQRSKCGTDEYRECFSDLEEGKGGDYDVLVHMLKSLLDHNDVYDIYLAMYDAENARMVYIVDPDPEDCLHPGEWETVTRKGMEKFLSWDGEGILYDMGKIEGYGWLCTTGTPIKDKNGNIAVFVLVDLTLKDVVKRMGHYALQISLVTVVITVIMALFLTRKMNRTVVEPINAIAEAAQEYVKDSRAGIGDKDHFKALDIQTGDEIENLSLIMADMESDLREIGKEFTEVTAENERIEAELSLATKLQNAFIPHIFPPFPDKKEIDLYASMTPAKEVGGDFFDYYLIDDDHLCFLIADVSGKGIPAALFMMVSKIILQSCAMLGQTVSETLAKTNEAICSNNEEHMFFTTWMGMLELSTGKLKAANAGHEYPVIKAPGGDYEMLKDKHGLVIGALAESKYTEYELQLEPGTKIFVYTDGLPEAMNGSGKMFGTDRILECLNRDKNACPHDILCNMKKAVDTYVEEAEQFDDLTMLCLEYKGG